MVDNLLDIIFEIKNKLYSFRLADDYKIFYDVLKKLQAITKDWSEYIDECKDIDERIKNYGIKVRESWLR